MKVQFTGFAPDLDPTTQGVIVDCTNLLPVPKGMMAAPAWNDEGLGALPSAAFGLVMAKNLTGSSARVFAGTSTEIYERSSGSWSSVGSGYSLGPDSRWRFAQFGNVTLASSKETIIQASTTGNFADVDASAPKAAVIEVINNQVFAANTNESTYGDDPIRWWFSAIGDETDWTPAISTGCVTGQFLDAPGAITAGRRLGDLMIAYKERAIFVGQYVGGSQIWAWTKIPGNIGVGSQEAVVTTGTAHYFFATDGDFYRFDGSVPTRIDAPVVQWVKDTTDPLNVRKVIGTYDSANGHAYWFFAGIDGAGKINKGLCYHVATNRWGRLDNTGGIDAAAEYIQAGITYDDLGTSFATYDDLPTNISYESPFWTADKTILAVISSADFKTYTLSGSDSSVPATIKTGMFGDDEEYSVLTRIKPRFTTEPTSGAFDFCLSYGQPICNISGGSGVYVPATGFVDHFQSARWHQVTMTLYGQFTITGMTVMLKPGGQ